MMGAGGFIKDPNYEMFSYEYDDDELSVNSWLQADGIEDDEADDNFFVVDDDEEEYVPSNEDTDFELDTTASTIGSDEEIDVNVQPAEDHPAVTNNTNNDSDVRYSPISVDNDGGDDEIPDLTQR